MDIHYINKKNYYLVDDILNNTPIYSKGCRNSRDFIKKKTINKKYYIYGRYDDKTEEWLETEGKSVKFDKILIRKIYVDRDEELNKELNCLNEEIPKIVELNDNEKFKNNKNEIIEIETRGERNIDSIFFRVKDIMIGFDMPNLDDTIRKINREGYIEDIHYKYFNIINKDNDCKKQVKKEIYLTYEGILRVLFVSRTENVKQFIKWATEKLFIIQLGSPEQKKKLCSDILGVNANMIKEVYNTSVHTLSCIYLFTLGNVKNLRESMKIDAKYDDTSIVCKYGFTKDISRRTSEHMDTFNKISNANLKLKCHAYIDPQYMSKGESEIRNFMNTLNIKMNYENNDELVIIPLDLLSLVLKQYEYIGKSYMGYNIELITKIKELETMKEKVELSYELELNKEKHNNELLRNQIEYMKEKHDHELLKRDMELLKMKLKN